MTLCVTLGTFNFIEKRANKALKKGLVVTSYLLLVLLAQSGPTTMCIGAQKPLHDKSDGSRAIPVHVIPLFTNDPIDEEKTLEITPDDELLLPFSTRRTCSECHIYEHNYEIIMKGWHFNAADPNVLPGRPGQPWILVGAGTGTQIPLSLIHISEPTRPY